MVHRPLWSVGEVFVHDTALALHIAAGAVGLLAGPTAGVARKVRGMHTAAGWTYQLCVAVLCSTSFLLVAMDPTLWPFAVIAAATWSAAAAAVVVRRRRRPGWVPLHAQLVLGSYVSFVTAFSVQTVGGPASWLVPTVIGSAVVGAVTTRVARQQRRPGSPERPAGMTPAPGPQDAQAARRPEASVPL